MAAITAEHARALATQFAQEVTRAYGDEVRAIALIGSLAAGSYRPGRSDIDTAVIVRDGASPGDAIRAIARRYAARHQIPKGFGAVVIAERALHPPYDPDRGLAREVLRLRRQGVILQGRYDLRALPEPSAADLRADARTFYPWLRANYIDRRPVARTVDAVVDTIVEELRLYVWDRLGSPGRSPLRQGDGRAVLPRRGGRRAGAGGADRDRDVSRGRSRARRPRGDGGGAARPLPIRAPRGPVVGAALKHSLFDTDATKPATG